MGGKNNRRVTLLGSIIALLVFNAMTLYFLYTDMAQVTDLTALHLDLFQLIFGLWGVGMVILGNIMPSSAETPSWACAPLGARAVKWCGRSPSV